MRLASQDFSLDSLAGVALLPGLGCVTVTSPSGFCWDLFVPDIQVDELVLGEFFLSSSASSLAKAKENDPV